MYVIVYLAIYIYTIQSLRLDITNIINILGTVILVYIWVDLFYFMIRWNEFTKPGYSNIENVEIDFFFS